MRIALSRVRTRRHGAEGDAGFTLLEVVVAMVVLLIVFTATAGVLTGMLRTTQQARQQQAANRLADQAMEQVRALPYATVIAGSTKDVATDPDVTSVSGAYYYGTEALDWNSTSAGNTTPLDTYPWPQQTANGTVFTTKTFITCKHLAFTGTGTEPSCTADLGPDDQLMYKATVVVEWVPNGAAAPKSVSTQSVVYSPKGCQSTLTHPIAAPCEPFFYGSADSGQGLINIRQAPPDSTTGVSAGPAVAALPGFTSATLSTSRATVTLQSEQTAKTSGGADASLLSWVVSGAESTLGGTQTTASASNDAGSASAATDSQPMSQPLGSHALSSSDGLTALTLQQGAVSGSTLATSSSATPACSDTANPSQTLLTSMPCANSSAVPGGMSASLTVPSAGTATLVSLGAPSGTAPLAAFTGRFKQSTGTAPYHCKTPLIAGCEGSEARRSLGDLLVGGLPSNVPPGHMPVGWDATKGLVKVTGYSDSASTERGDETTNPAPTAGVSGGILTYWTGSGYSSVTLATGLASTPASGTVIGVALAPVADAADDVTVEMTGTITVGGPATTTKGNLADCASAQCVATASVSSFVIDVTYIVRSASTGAVLANLDINTDLGKLLASSTYQAAPSGS